MTELLICTKKGLFVLDGEAGGEFTMRARAFAGEPVEHAIRDPRTGRLLAATTSPFYGPKIWHTDEPPATWSAEHPGGAWKQAQGVALPEGGEHALKQIWALTPGERDGLVYAGGDPGVLLESHDGGESFSLNGALWQEPTRPHWQPGGGGLCLHSIATWPGDPARLAVAISAAGVWLTEDGGQSWRKSDAGLAARYLPDEVPEELRAQLEAGGRAAEQAGCPPLCVHHLERSRARPERMFMQFHGGVYRSDDAGSSWSEIGAGLPSDFGFPLAVDPDDPDSAFVIPLSADMDRVTPGGRVRVYETRDAGTSWSARGAGLPDGEAYLTVLRQAFASAGAGQELELYFGATSGEVFGSFDAGASWHTIARRLPPVYGITCSPRV